MKRLIVNADDFGYTRGVNRAIVDAFRRGIVTSTSLLANASAFDDAVEQARRTPGLDVGCHLNFVEGRPIAPPSRIPHLAPGGKFPGVRRLALGLLLGRIPAHELEMESSAQIEKLMQAGIRPSHVDSHQHAHLHPLVASVVAAAARRFEISWVRRPFENYLPPNVEGSGLRKIATVLLNLFFARRFERTIRAAGLRLPDYFTGFLLTGRLTKRTLAATLSALPDGVTELMCHPGYCDAELQASPTRLQQQREQERSAVADGALRESLAARGVLLTGFRQISPEPPCFQEKPALAVPQAVRGD